MVFLSRWLRATVNPRAVQVQATPSMTYRAMGVGMFVVLACIGEFMDRQEVHRQVHFRDKSKLFGGLNPDPENTPFWGNKTYDYPVSRP